MPPLQGLRQFLDVYRNTRTFHNWSCYWKSIHEPNPLSTPWREKGACGRYPTKVRRHADGCLGKPFGRPYANLTKEKMPRRQAGRARTVLFVRLCESNVACAILTERTSRRRITGRLGRKAGTVPNARPRRSNATRQCPFQRILRKHHEGENATLQEVQPRTVPNARPWRNDAAGRVLSERASRRRIIGRLGRKAGTVPNARPRRSNAACR